MTNRVVKRRSPRSSDQDLPTVITSLPSARAKFAVLAALAIAGVIVDSPAWTVTICAVTSLAIPAAIALLGGPRLLAVFFLMPSRFGRADTAALEIDKDGSVRRPDTSGLSHTLKRPPQRPDQRLQKKPQVGRGQP
ncbi:hypothetical protein OG400_27390 [Micromonospora ureilytica]|uniref:hypothetical protein n=1 Tax=Micromonospora ureilytica TaxID=709868 RepID=UPI002E102DAA|nr:hypothetical protein OG400_27390 [Micromonospora ureilytica]